MGGVAEGAEVGVVRCKDVNTAARDQQPVEFLHGTDYIRDMLDDVGGAHFPERIVTKREWEVVQVGNDVGLGVDVAVEPDRTGVFVDSAADVEDG